MKRSMSFYLWVVVILGALEFLSEIVLQGAPKSLHNASVVLYVLAGIATFMVGRKARQERGNPMAAGAALGSVFGVFIGVAPFFIHVTAKEIQSRFPHLSAAKLQQGVLLANQASTHIAGLVTSVFMLAIIGFIISFIGSAVTARPPVEAAAETTDGSTKKGTEESKSDSGVAKELSPAEEKVQTQDGAENEDESKAIQGISTQGDTEKSGDA